MKSNRVLFFLLAALLILPVFFTAGRAEDATDDAVGSNDAPRVEPELKANEKIGSKTDDEVIQREEEQINPDGFNVKELKQLKERAQTLQFQAEVNKLMNIIINSLYSNTEVFLREVISNASDALDKIRFVSLTDSAQLNSGSKLEIKIRADKNAKTLTITDTGIGMTREDLINNLGTIAKSGTTEFIQSVQESGATNNLIGQFGVGFYSVFLVADTVTVISKNNNDKQYVWQSDAHGSFSITEDPRGDTLGRGTSLILHIKDDAQTFLDQNTLRGLVKKYSEFINFPIYLWTENEVEKEVPLTEEELAEQKKKAAEEKKDEDEEKVKLDEDEEESSSEEEELPTTKTIKEKVYDYELMNEVKPIWTRNPKEISDEEYNNFYKVIARDTEDPMLHIHFNAEGDVDFRSLLYVPGTAPSNLFDPNVNQQGRGIKLYVRRVFITDDFRDILPKYLNFLRGLVDSDDLPLNVSREMLQEHKNLQAIKKKIVRKAIAMFQELAEEDKEKFLEFFKAFGTNLKLGVIEDVINRTRLSKLLRFYSSKSNGELIGLQDYVDRMKEGQTQIYYLAGESREAVENSPLIERLIKKGYEVLYLTEPIDEYCVSSMDKFDGKFKLTNIAREGLTFDGEEVDKEKEKETKQQYSNLISYLKKQLGTKIERVTISNRLASSPTALVSSTYGWTANMERIVKAQALGDPNAKVMAPKKVLEINPRHPLIAELNRRVSDDENDPQAKEIAQLMYDTAVLSSGYSLEDPSDFAHKIVQMMNKNLNLDPNAAPVEEEEASSPKTTEAEEEHEEKDEL